MPLNRQTIIDEVRSTNPEYFEDWSDQKLYAYIKQDIPELERYDESPGEAAYKAYGAQEVPGFKERFFNQLENQITETKTGLYGLSPFTETEAYEQQRIYNQNLYKQKIADSVELQALTAWKEDEPGWTNLDTAARSLSEALPSLAVSITSTAVGMGLAAATGGSSLAFATGSLLPMFGMEAGAQYNEVMSTLVDDIGLDPEEARGYAGITSLAYGSISSMLERVGAKHFLSLVGLREVGEQIAKRTIAQRIVDSGLNAPSLVRGGIRASAGAAKVLEGSLREGLTETMQAYTQNTMNKALELGLGEDDLSAKVALQNAFVETWDEKAVWEEGFAGATTGILGLPFGVGTRTQAGQTTTADIRKKKAELQDEADLVGTPVGDLKEGEVKETVAPSGIVSQYIEKLDNDEELVDFIESIPEDTPNKTLKTIKEVYGSKVSIGKKFLRIIGNDEKIIQEIADSDKADFLLTEIANEIIQAEGTPKDIKSINIDEASKKEKINIISNWAKYGKIIKGEVAADVGIGEQVDDYKLVYEPPPPEPYTPSEIVETERKKVDTTMPVYTEGEKIKLSDDFNLDTLNQKAKQSVSQLEKGSEYQVIKDNPKTVTVQKIEDGKLTGRKINVFKKAIMIQKEGQKYGESTVAHLSYITGEKLKFPKQEVEDTIITPSGKKINVDELVTWREDPAEPAPTDYSKMLNRDLKEELKARKLPLSGNKAALIKRLEESDAAQVEETESKEQVDKYLEPMDRVQFPPAKSREEQIAVVDGKEVKLTEEELNSLELFIEMDSSAVQMVKTQAQAMLLEIGRTLIEKHGKAEVKAEAKAEVPPETVKEPTVAPTTDVKSLTPQEQFEAIDKQLSDERKKAIMDSLTDQSGEKKIQMTEAEMNWAFVNMEMNKPEDVFTQEKLPSELEKRKAETQKPKEVSRKENKLDTEVTDENQEKEKVSDENLTEEEKLLKMKSNLRTKVSNNLKNKENLIDDDKTIGDQAVGSSNLPYIKDSPEFASRLAKRLKKFFPWVEQATFEGLIEEYGSEKIGQATESLVTWSTTDGRLDTIPHEYAHIYIKMFASQDIVKKGIKLFKSEEDLVLAIGKYYVNRMQNEPRSLRLKFEKWLKQFVARVKRMFGFEPETKQEIMEFIAEEFYQGRWLGVEPDILIPFTEFMAKPEETSDDFDDTTSDEAHEATGGEALNKTNSMSSADAYNSFYKEVFGIYLSKQNDYPKMVELILKKHDTFEEYLDDVYKLLQSVVDKRKYDKDKNLVKQKDLSEKQLMLLKREWVKGRQRITRLSPTDKSRRGRDTRLYYRIIRNYDLDNKTVIKGKENWRMGLEIADEKDRVNGKLFPSTVIRNSIERDFQNKKHNIRIGILPIKQIMRRVGLRDGSEFYVESAVELSMDDIVQMQSENNQRYGEKLDKQLNRSLEKAKKSLEEGVDIDKIKEDLKNDLKKADASLLAINGTKPGDNASVVGSVIEGLSPHELTPMMFKQIIDNELAVGNIRQEHYDIMVRDSFLDSLMDNDDDIINFTLSEYIDKWISDNPDKKITELINEIKESISDLSLKADMSATLQNLRFWQGVRTPDYFMYEKSAADSMIRLSVDMAEGQRPVNLRDMRLMIIPKDYVVVGQIPKTDKNGNVIRDKNGKLQMVESSPIKYDEFDGASLVGSKYLSEMAEDIGYEKFQQIKTFIRHRDVDEKTGKKNYLGMKHMMFSGFKNMIIKDKNDNIIARMETGDDGLTYWVEEQSKNKFEMIASPNEAKMTFGDFASLEQKAEAFGGKPNEYKSDDIEKPIGYGVIHTIPSSSIIVNNVQEYSKDSASHPIALGEMLLMYGYENKFTDNVLKAIRSRYNDIASYYTDRINEFYKNPKVFREFIYKAEKDGQIPSELQQYLKLIGDSGEGLFHPAIKTHILPVVNSILIRQGLYKARAWDGKSSILYIKPAFNNLSNPNQHVKQGNVVLSSDNKVAYNQVFSKWKEHIGEEAFEKVMSSEKYRTGKGLDKHRMIREYLNPFLEKNSVSVLIHRNPISKVTGPAVRRVQALVEGQGEAMLLTWKDVKRIFDGDWDGDKGVFEFIDDDYIDSMNEWQAYAGDNKLERTVSLPIMGARVDDENNKVKTHAVSPIHTSLEIQRNAKNTGTTGVALNSRTIMAQLYSKDFTMDVQSEVNGKLTAIQIKASSPDKEVVMDYIEIDKSQLTKEEINILKENGDSLVTKDGTEINLDDAAGFEGELYLKTIKSHELAILFQMAVDGSKFTHLADILSKMKDDNGEPLRFNDFISSRIFERSVVGTDVTNNNFTTAELSYLNFIKSAQNVSKIRAGRTETGISADFDINVDVSNELNQMFNGDERIEESKLLSLKSEGILSNDDYSYNFKSKVNKIKNERTKRSSDLSDLMNMIKSVKINLKNYITPVESLLISLGNNLNYDIISAFQSDQLAKNSHIAAVTALFDSPTIKKYLEDMKTDKDKLSAYQAAQDFLHTGLEVFSKDTTALEEFLDFGFKKIDKKNMSFMDIWNRLMEKTADRQAIQSDKNLAFAEFTDRFIDKFESLNDDSKMWITLQYLTGQAYGDKVYIEKLLPKAFLHDEIMKVYLPSYENHIREAVRDNTVGKEALNPAKMREKLEQYGYRKELNDIKDVMNIESKNNDSSMENKANCK